MFKVRVDVIPVCWSLGILASLLRWSADIWRTEGIQDGGNTKQAVSIVGLAENYRLHIIAEK